MEPDLDTGTDNNTQQQQDQGGSPEDILVRLLGGDQAGDGKQQQDGARANGGADDGDTDPDDEDDAGTRKEPAPRTFKVKVDGQDVEVSEAELLAGYSRQGDYSKKTAALAQERAQLQQVAQAVQAERQQHQNQLAQLTQALGLQLQEQSQINWQQLLEQNPQEYLKQRHLFEQRQAALQHVQRVQQQAQAEAQQHQAQQNHQRLQSEHQALLDKLPDWKDADKAKAEQGRVRDYLKGQGYTDEDVAGVSDHRAVVMARKAMLYDDLVAKAATNAEKVKNLPAPKVLQPGGREVGATDGRTRAMKNLAKTGSTDAAADVLMALMSR